MSGLNEIIQWTDDEINIEQGENPQEAFEFIDSEFIKDNRLPLADILGDQISEYLEYLQDRAGFEFIDSETELLQQRASRLEVELERLLGFNILGTPIR